MAEPVHGSAPDIVGKSVANPSGALLAAALLARFHWRRDDIATRIEKAVYATLADGVCTPDLGGSAKTGEMIDAVLRKLA